jgi:hypothetical protein
MRLDPHGIPVFKGETGERKKSLGSNFLRPRKKPMDE